MFVLKHQFLQGKKTLVNFQSQEESFSSLHLIKVFQFPSPAPVYIYFVYVIAELGTLLFCLLRSKKRSYQPETKWTVFTFSSLQLLHFFVKDVHNFDMDAVFIFNLDV